jgi:cytochrome c-type biogenesis protein CcmH
MLLWIAFALLTSAVLAAVLAPLGRTAPAGDAQAAAEDAAARAVYRDQLAEIEAERAAGLIGAAEAEAARIEVSRRLLATAATPAGTAAARSPSAPAAAPVSGRVPRHESLMLATAIAVPLLTLGLYLAHGSPGVSSGASTEADREFAKVVRMIAKVEERLKQEPEDGKGWEVIAPVYLKLGRYADAASAYANAVRLQGESVRLLAGLAEASVMAKDGMVTEEARAAYAKMLQLEPGRVEPRFWLALGKEQDGRLAEALADYSALLKEAPTEAPYRPTLESRIAEVSGRLKTAPDPKDKAPTASGKAPSGPTAADIEAAAKLGAEERAALIKGMVDGLAERLKRDGKDLPGWKRLIQSYQALDRPADARAALAEARRQLAGNAEALADLNRLAAQLGLGS